MASKLRVADTESEMRECFRVMDRDGNGVLSPMELKTVLRAMGEAKEKASSKEGEGTVKAIPFDLDDCRKMIHYVNESVSNKKEEQKEGQEEEEELTGINFVKFLKANGMCKTTRGGVVGNTVRPVGERKGLM